MAYKFRLAKIREARQHDEIEKARVLSDARDAAEAQQEKLERMRLARDANFTELRDLQARGMMPSGDVVNYMMTLEMQDSLIEEAGVLLASLRHAESVAERVYMHARSERRTLDTLEEKQKEAYRIEEGRKEEKDNEEFSRILRIMRRD